MNHSPAFDRRPDPSRTRPMALGLAAMALFMSVGQLAAAPLLRCQVAYAGTTHAIEASPVADPYLVTAADIGGRFRFKAVMVGTAEQIAYIKLYSYLETSRQPILIHESKYLPPFKASTAAMPFTGELHLYAGPVERELITRCWLEGVPS